MGDVHGQSNVGEVEAVAEADEGQGDEVVADELLVVLARPLHAEDEHNGLLGPVGGLEEIVELEDGLVGLVREALVEARGVEVPDGRPAHDIHAPGAGAGKVGGRVHLLHEAGLFPLGLEAGEARQGPQQLLHDELAGEGQHDDVEGDEGDVPEALAIMRRGVRVGAGGDGQLVTEEDEVVDGVGLGGVQGVEAAEDEEQEGGQGPRVLEGVVGRPLRQAPRLASLGLAFRGRRGAVFRVGPLQFKSTAEC